MRLVDIDGNKVLERKRVGTIAFWMKGGEVVENSNSHIRVIIDNPEKFGVTSEYIQSVYDKHGETLGVEGEAREEVIREVSRNGWVRIRHYTSRGSDYWSIQVDRIRRRKEQIQDFIFWAIENEYMTMNDELRIVGYDDEQVQVYSFFEGGVKAYLEEKKRKEEKTMSKGKREEEIIRIPEDVEVPGTGIVLEKGDRIRIMNEAVKPNQILMDAIMKSVKTDDEVVVEQSIFKTEEEVIGTISSLEVLDFIHSFDYSKTMDLDGIQVWGETKYGRFMIVIII